MVMFQKAKSFFLMKPYRTTSWQTKGKYKYGWCDYLRNLIRSITNHREKKKIMSDWNWMISWINESIMQMRLQVDIWLKIDWNRCIGISRLITSSDLKWCAFRCFSEIQKPCQKFSIHLSMNFYSNGIWEITQYNDAVLSVYTFKFLCQLKFRQL